MKGNNKVIAALNKALSSELIAINQYILHAEMFDNWGYCKLGKMEMKLARCEMHHTHNIVERILFLEGKPEMTNYTALNIGATIPAMIESDHALEQEAIKIYNDLIETCLSAKDNGTVKLGMKTLEDEEEHIATIEAELEMIKDIGLENYLSSKM
jgi:bacterioferritin